jgi:hypothetical protein
VSKLLRATAWKTGLVVLSGCCLAVVIVAGASATATGAPPVDHQLCYSASGTFNVPKGVALIDQFSPNGFVPTISNNAVLHCNPVIKTVKTASGQTRVFKVTNPAAHLACFGIASEAQQPTPKVTVTNQFGTALLQPKQPNLLCVPSWKSLTGPPDKKPTTPPNLSHFTCYPVAVLKGGYRPPAAIALRDEFAGKPVSVKVGRVPQELCLPTEKVVPNAVGGGVQDYPIINKTLHLLCFGGIKTPIKNPVYDENQFGTSKVAIRASKWLCLPSIKKLG